MDHRVGPAQRLDRLAEVGEVGDELVAGDLGRAHEVDAQDVLSVCEQIGDDGASRLAAPAGDDDAAHQRCTAAPAEGCAVSERPSCPVRSR